MKKTMTITHDHHVTMTNAVQFDISGDRAAPAPLKTPFRWWQTSGIAPIVNRTAIWPVKIQSIVLQIRIRNRHATHQVTITPADLMAPNCHVVYGSATAHEDRYQFIDINQLRFDDLETKKYLGINLEVPGTATPVLSISNLGIHLWYNLRKELGAFYLSRAMYAKTEILDKQADGTFVQLLDCKSELEVAVLAVELEFTTAEYRWVAPTCTEMLSPDPFIHIERVGRKCYKSEDKITDD
jgi:hypothetical protein